jgi:predicted nucleic acid-binding protein
VAVFVVYLETNWLVSCVLPHHPWRKDARSLLDAADRGDCALRIPKAAFLEARHVVERETQDHTRNVSAVAASFDAAGNNLVRQDLRHLATKVVDAEISYRLANPRHELEGLILRCTPFAVHHPLEEQAALDALRPQVGMRGSDIADLHLLGAMLADRDLDPAPEAAVLSTNSKEFAVKGTNSKLPRDLYASRRLVYMDTFNLEGARRLWLREAASGWPVPQPPSADPRRGEAMKLVHALSEERLDDALAALRGLSASPAPRSPGAR